MKITTFRSQVLNVPEDEPLADAVEKEGGKRPIVILTLGTDSGIEGIGVSFYGGALTKTLKSAIDQLCELCVGEDPHRVEAIIRKLRDAAGGSGRAACSRWR
jgi:L-alanine-DL-glutamate epimerase-like enolase superfamily enzyme